jgi:osmoprotectant transport system permease protein
MNEVLREQLELAPALLAAHVELVLIALVAGIAISLPLALVCVRVRSLAAPVLAVAGVIQTIPALALLALMVPLLGQIGTTPALIALVLYSVLPIARNAVTGLDDLDPALLDAARGMGMTEGQTLLRVRLPLAAPVIVAGIRTAAVWTVGLATLSTPVGAPSLGNFIFSGLQTQNHTAVLVGCAAAAALALTLDGLVRVLEIAARRRSVSLASLGVAALAVIVAWLGWMRTERGFAGDRVRVGAKTFTEQYVLARRIATQLEQRGAPVELVEGLGSTVAFDALVAGLVDVYVDYTGTIWSNYMKRSDNPGARIVLEEVSQWLEREHGVVCLGALGFENAYAFAMPRARAEKLAVQRIDQLAPLAASLSIGGDYEFFARPEWSAVRDGYGLAFAKTRSFDPSLMFRAAATGEVDVLAAFSSDGRIAAFDLEVLEDPREVLPPYDAILLLSRRAAADGRTAAALRPLVGAIDDQAMRRANMLVDVEGRSVREAAASLADATPRGAAGDLELRKD